MLQVCKHQRLFCPCYWILGSHCEVLDLRQQNPAATLQCQERVYTMDVRNQLLVVGTADRYINIVDMNTPDKFYKTMQSPLKSKPALFRVSTTLPALRLVSIEGRCAIQYVDENRRLLKFSPSNATATHHHIRSRPPRYIERLQCQCNLLPPYSRHLQHRR